jgi:hypothetical protein
MPITIQNRTEKGSELTYAELDAILEALAEAVGVVVSGSQPASGVCPLWFDTGTLTLKVYDGAAWNAVNSVGATIYMMSKFGSA